jgi:isoquinoline 1-oxidoreductase alpha subunit
MTIKFTLNGQSRELDADPAMPLLWALRDLLGLKGAKYGCGIAACGACTVHVDGAAVRGCVMPIAAVAGKRVDTIEGLNGNHPVQRAWLDGQVPQCG